MSFLNKHKTAIKLAFIALLILSGIGFTRIELGTEEMSRSRTYIIITEHFGINSTEIEESITIPFENAISDLQGIKRIRSSSELSKSRIEIDLHSNTDSDEFYLDLRERINKVYTGLPDSVQKPRIISGAANNSTFYIASFAGPDLYSLRNYIESEIKTRFQQINGVGEIEISGGSIKEVQIELDQQKAGKRGIAPTDLAEILQKSGMYQPCGFIQINDNRRYLVTMDSRNNSLEELKTLPLISSRIQLNGLHLSDIADVNFGQRKQNSISTYNGESKVMVYIKPGGIYNPLELGNQLTELTAQLGYEGFNTETVFNRADALQRHINDVITACILSICSVAILALILQGFTKNTLVLVLSIPLIIAVSIAILSLSGFTITSYILSGLTLGTGIIVDTSIVILQLIQTKGTKGVKEVIIPLSISMLTSLIVLFPLLFLNAYIPGIYSLCLALAVLLVSSLLLPALFQPVFTTPCTKKISTSTGLQKAIQNVTEKSINNSTPVFLACGILLFAAFFLITSMPLAFSKMESQNTIFAHIEYESGASVESTARRTNEFIQIINKLPGIISIQSNARRDNAQISIKYDSAVWNSVAILKESLTKQSRTISKGFLSFPSNESAAGNKIEISITGPDISILKEYAKTTADVFNTCKWVSQVLLHFKNDPPAFVFHPYKTYLPNITSQQISQTIRWNLQGPVAVKWNNKGTETDIRIMGKERESLDDLKQLPVSGTIHLDQIGYFEESSEPSRIFRHNRQRSVYLSIDLKIDDIQQGFASIWEVLNTIDMQTGYSFSVDKKLAHEIEFFSSLRWIFIFSLFLVYALIACQSNSLLKPLYIMSIAPLSIAVPLIILALLGKPLTSSVMTGFIMLSGMSVNNGILIHEEFMITGNPEKAVSSRLSAMIFSTLTTVIGGIPLLMMNYSAWNFSATLALVMTTGILTSFFVSITFLPTILKIKKPLLKRE